MDRTAAPPPASVLAGYREGAAPVPASSRSQASPV